ncbi:hypothetical protein QBC40DRAFT_159144, partial [Triangularia verruculosa]
MEAIASGASVLAFVTLSLQSAKVIREILSTVKDGSDCVERVLRDVQGLQDTLRRVKQCCVNSPADKVALESKIKSCGADLKACATELENLVAKAPESTLARQWKKMKIFLKEKDVEKVGHCVVRNTSALNLYLGAIANDALQDVVLSQRAISATQTTMVTELTTIAVQQKNTTTAVQEAVTQLTDGVHSIEETVRATMSTQTDEIAQKLAQTLEQALRQLSLLPASSKRVVEEVNEDGSNERVFEEVNGEDSNDPDLTAGDASENMLTELGGIIESILNEIRDKKGVLTLHQFRKSSAANSLASLFKILASEEFIGANDLVMSISKECLASWTSHELEELQRILPEIHGILLSARRLSLNEPSTPKREFSGALFHHESKKRSYSIGFGSISVLTHSRLWKKQCLRQVPYPNCEDSTDDIIEDTETRIIFIPTMTGHVRESFHAVLRQIHHGDGTSSSIPNMSMYNVLPWNSRVFSVVEQGRLAELREMLRLGEASLRDQDEYGTPLLFYGNENPEMCRFLLEQGADANYVAEHPSYSGENHLTTAMFQIIDDEETDKDGFHRQLECRILLLRAGCDPLWSTEDPGVSMPYNSPPTNAARIFRNGVPESMRVLFDCTDALVTPDTIVDAGQKHTPLLAYCCADMRSPRYSIEGFSLLLNQGSDVNARDVYGQNCLHICLDNITYLRGGTRTLEYLDQVRHSLAYLIGYGALVNAVDNQGLSVS